MVQRPRLGLRGLRHIDPIANTKEHAMQNEAIASACTAYAELVGELIFADGMQAAISAYFADVPVSDDMLQVGGVEVHGHKRMSALESAHLARGLKAMCSQHAKELNNV